MTQKRVVFLVLMLIAGSLFGQSNDIDSLKALLPNVHDTVRMKLYYELSMQYKENLTDSAEFYARLAVDESARINYSKGQADGLISLGRIKRDAGKLAEGLELISKSLEIYRKIDDLVQMGNAYNDISIVYAMTDDYEKSLEYFQKSLDMFQQANDQQGISYALNNIGIVYQVLGQDSLAREYFIRSLNIKEKNSDTYGIAQVYVNLANILSNYELFGEALSYYLKADSAFSLIHNKRGATRNLVYISEMLFEMQEMDQAFEYAQKAYNLSEEFDFKLFQQDALESLVNIAVGKGDYELALNYQKQYQLVKDSLALDQQVALREELMVKFELDEKNREIQLLKNKDLLSQAESKSQRLTNYLLIASIAFMIVLISLLGFGYLHNKKKNKALTDINKEKDRFISILSHDVKGPLNTLKGFSSLLMTEDSKLTDEEMVFFGKKINDSIENLLKLINGVLDWFFSKNSASTVVPEQLEVKSLVDDVIQLYALTAYQKNIRVINEIKRTDKCLADRNTVLTVLRNLLSNALKFSKSGDSIRFYSESEKTKRIKILISDTGVGIAKRDLPNLFKYSKSKIKQGTQYELGSGLGLALSKELVETNGGELSVESEIGVGSRFIITLPATT